MLSMVYAESRAFHVVVLNVIMLSVVAPFLACIVSIYIHSAVEYKASA